ncbi:MAG TPA: hypothetical protein VF399_11970 [bacterium]|jgi:hypothetical protein
MNITVEQAINIVTVNSRSAVIRELGQIRTHADIIEDELRDKNLINLTDQQRDEKYRLLIKALSKIFATCDHIKQDCRALYEILEKAFPDVALNGGVLDIKEPEADRGGN